MYLAKVDMYLIYWGTGMGKGRRGVKGGGGGGGERERERACVEIGIPLLPSADKTEREREEKSGKTQCTKSGGSFFPPLAHTTQTTQT